VSTVAIVQARTGSTRLPGKVLLPLLGEPMLLRVMRRLSRATRLDKIVLATTTMPADDPIVELGGREGWPVERGSESDLLDRYVQAARSHRAGVVVRITSDCPLIDPGVVDRVVGAFAGSGVDYASNTLAPRTFPQGLDVEVMTIQSLERAWREDANPAWREHATPYLYRHPELFALLRVPNDVDESRHRWSVDTAEDYALVRRIYETLGRDDFDWHEALALVDKHPGWHALNRDVIQKRVPSP
jgi:spore coat polysaccharide biosynthesis protein SpsF